ncbi:MAG TPA: outer membrane beta-barrel protein [Chitinophagaceae bacterium]|nr:outer membrane beta-barrel protein [Chitinophagaceae bacterium]
MYKPDDKDIDRISRDAAEHYHAPGRPSWDALQQVLDKELPQEKEKKRRGFFFFFFLALGLSVAGAGVWYLLPHAATPSSLTRQTSSKPLNGSNPGTPLPENKLPETNAGTDKATASQSIHDQEKAASIKTEQPQEAGNKEPGNRKENKKPNETTTPPAANNRAVIARNSTVLPPANAQRVQSLQANLTERPNRNSTRSNARPTRNHPGVASTPADADALALTDKSSPRNRPYTTNNRKNTNNKHNTVLQQRANKEKNEKDISVAQDESTATATSIENEATAGKNQSPTAVTASDSLAKTPPIAINTQADSSKPAAKALTKAAEKKQAPVRKRAINIGLTAGVDVSTVKFTHGDNAGYNFGIMGGYQFSSHWSVYTGLVYTKKNYTLNGEDYHPPKHYWTQYVQLETVAGYCRMWELPLQARYTFNPSAKTPFFASAGLSSYFMKKQGYTYYYKTMNMPYSTDWTNDSTFTHVFSVLHLSAGFERKIGDHLNFQVEPYAKIPLGGVGFGNIRLSSFGVNFTVQYRQPVKR